MIVFASATPAGCTLTTDKGVEHFTVYGSDSNVGIAHFSSTPDTTLPENNWTAAAFIILADSDEKIITKAIANLPQNGKKLTTSRIALAIQKIERANQNNTSKPKSYGEYDGTELRETAKYEYAEGRMVTDEAPVSISRRDIRGARLPLHHQHKGSLHTPHTVAGATQLRTVEEYEEPKVWYAADAGVEWKYAD